MSDLTEAAMGAGGATASAADPMADGADRSAGGSGPAGSGNSGAGASGTSGSGTSGSGASEAPAKEPTSDWFAPRKPSAPRATLPVPGGRVPGNSPADGDPFGARDPLGDDSTGSLPRPDFDTGAGSGFDTGSSPAFGTGSSAAFASDPFGTDGAGLDTTEHGQGGAGDTFGGGPLTDRSEYGGFAEHPEGSGSTGPQTPGGIDPKALGSASSAGRSGLYDLFGEPAPGDADQAGTGGERSSGTFDVLGDAAGGTGGHRAPGGSERSSGTFDVSGAIATGPLGAGGRNAGPRPSDLSYFDGESPAGTPETAPEDPGGKSVLPRRPTGPTGGPVTGDSTLGSAGGADEAPGAPRADDLGPGAPGGLSPRPRMSDDTAVLTPQKPAPDPGGRPDDNVSGHTVTSGIRVVPSRQKSPFGGPAQQADTGSVPHTPPKLPAPEARSTSAAPAPAKKGRSKLVLLAVLVVVLAGGVYGAGLLVNHADVAKGTTVLGVDIGGGTRDEAVKKLDAAFGGRTSMPLTLSVAGKSVQLRPDQAGLAMDADATVQAAAGSDYNPVTVVGSLFGAKRIVQPVMPVDEEKLHAALDRAAGGAGSANDGTIRFEPGRVVPVYGKAGKSIDADKSSSAVQAAYRTLIETGHSNPVAMPLAEHRPTVSNAEVDRMMREFATPAMSGIVTIKAGSVSIPFGPEKSLPQILGVQAVDGKLVDTYDRAALKKLYGTTFDGVLITRATGKKTPVTPEDVIGVMRKALLGKTPAERVGVIETDPN